MKSKFLISFCKAVLAATIIGAWGCCTTAPKDGTITIPKPPKAFCVETDAAQ